MSSLDRGHDLEALMQLHESTGHIRYHLKSVTQLMPGFWNVRYRIHKRM